MIEVSMETTEDKIREISEHYSKRNQWQKAIEEVQELLDELKKAGNPLGDEDIVCLTGNTWSEYADVLVIMSQLAKQHGMTKEVQKQLEFKVDRQLGRIEAEKSGEIIVGDIVQFKDEYINFVVTEVVNAKHSYLNGIDFRGDSHIMVCSNNVEKTGRNVADKLEEFLNLMR